MAARPPARSRIPRPDASASIPTVAERPEAGSDTDGEYQRDRSLGEDREAQKRVSGEHLPRRLVFPDGSDAPGLPARWSYRPPWACPWRRCVRRRRIRPWSAERGAHQSPRAGSRAHNPANRRRARSRRRPSAGPRRAAVSPWPARSKDRYGEPVVERRLLQPRPALERRRDPPALRASSPRRCARNEARRSRSGGACRAGEKSSGRENRKQEAGAGSVLRARFSTTVNDLTFAQAENAKGPGFPGPSGILPA